MTEQIEKKPIIWWKDKKLLAGIILVLLSAILGFYGKVVIISRFYEPLGLLTGFSIYAFSFILLFVGIFLVGWETIKMIKYRIHHHLKETARRTYNHAKQLPVKGYHYTKELHKKSINKIKKTIMR
ncbi:hypothetical protein HYX02_04045 [Candidatus Woesearchaeota archaeon]|nr:hypothetical protein [Candidatus Woesearchaeota archaeon]